MPAHFFFGLDLGQAADYTALAILERIPPAAPAAPLGWTPYKIRAVEAEPEPQRTRYELRHLERVRLGTSYPAIVQYAARLLTTAPLQDAATLIVDYTGGGRPTFDMFVAAGLAPVGITITGGDAVVRDGAVYRVPKRDLISALVVLFQSDRLKIARRLPAADALVHELVNFRRSVSLKTGHDSYEAWRESDHDDLVLATAMAAWYAEHAWYEPQPSRQYGGYGPAKKMPAGMSDIRQPLARRW